MNIGSPINTTTHYLLLALVGLGIMGVMPWPWARTFGIVLLVFGLLPALAGMVKSEWQWIKDHTTVKFWG